MTYRQLEDQINKWNVELEEQERIFLKQAETVASWDRMVLLNGDSVSII
jgi:nuclear pore complex protein Nup62